jgi:hypothetical protein
MSEPTAREIIKTEDRSGSVITVDSLTDDYGSTEHAKSIRLWSADFTYLARWCFDCKRFHNATDLG